GAPLAPPARTPPRLRGSLDSRPFAVRECADSPARTRRICCEKIARRLARPCAAERCRPKTRAVREPPLGRGACRSPWGPTPSGICHRDIRLVPSSPATRGRRLPRLRGCPALRRPTRVDAWAAPRTSASPALATRPATTAVGRSLCAPARVRDKLL